MDAVTVIMIVLFFALMFYVVLLGLLLIGVFLLNYIIKLIRSPQSTSDWI